MALGRRKECRQQELFVTANSLPTSDGHVFYSKLNQLLADEGFDQWIEELCASFLQSQPWSSWYSTGCLLSNASNRLL